MGNCSTPNELMHFAQPSLHHILWGIFSLVVNPAETILAQVNSVSEKNIFYFIEFIECFEDFYFIILKNDFL
jgi:hypothetical protein